MPTRAGRVVRAPDPPPRRMSPSLVTNRWTECELPARV